MYAHMYSNAWKLNFLFVYYSLLNIFDLPSARSSCVTWWMSCDIAAAKPVHWCDVYWLFWGFLLITNIV